MRSDDTIISTLLQREDGQRVVGVIPTQQIFAHVREDGTYRGHEVIEGEQFLTAADPIRNMKGDPDAKGGRFSKMT